MKSASYSLNEPLPPEIAPGATSLPYEKYPVFGWPWFWRRLLILGALALFAAIAFGRMHGNHVDDQAQGFTVAWRVAVAYLLLVGCGPLLATAIRQMRLSESLEPALLVFAIVIGLFAADIAGRWADDYHDELMRQHRMTMMRMPLGMALGDNVGDTAWRLLQTLAIYYFCGGGWDLRTYLLQQNRWRQHHQQRDIQALQLQKQRADMRLSILQAQVEPHFLFNTLASVRSLVHSDPQRAANTIDAMVDHLRASLPKIRGEEAAHSLADQIEICRSYLEVMRVRMGDRLRVAFHVPPELAALPFPPLMLLSLAENAIKHGVEPKAGACSIVVEAERLSDGMLEVRVIDDGVGLRAGPSDGVGLANIRAQLATRFGERASLRLESREQGGVVAAIRVPLEQTKS
jgi:signal transduction histidine kinase